MSVFQVKNLVETGKLKSDLSYSLTDLSSAMMEQASLFAHYGVQLALASRQVDTLKLLVETAESAVYRREREEALNAGTKLTEVQLEKLVSRHSKVIDMKKALIEAKQIESIAKTAVEAFKQRRDMLVQSGATEREERKGEVVTAMRSAREELAHQTQGAVLKRQQDRVAAQNAEEN